LIKIGATFLHLRRLRCYSQAFPKVDSVFGAALASTAFLATILEPAVALGLMLPLLLPIDFGGLRPYGATGTGALPKIWRWDRCPALRRVSCYLRAANPDALRFLIGVAAMAFVVYQGAKARGWTGTTGKVTLGGADFGRSVCWLHQLRQPFQRTDHRDISAAQGSWKDHVPGHNGDRLLGQQQHENAAMRSDWFIYQRNSARCAVTVAVLRYSGFGPVPRADST
jgi:hypothetical protein